MVSAQKSISNLNTLLHREIIYTVEKFVITEASLTYQRKNIIRKIEVLYLIIVVILYSFSDYKKTM